MGKDKILGKEELFEYFQRLFTRWGGLVGKEMQAYEQIRAILQTIPDEGELKQLIEFIERRIIEEYRHMNSASKDSTIWRRFQKMANRFESVLRILQVMRGEKLKTEAGSNDQ